jgi:histidinol-phosphate aminotransferase
METGPGSRRSEESAAMIDLSKNENPWPVSERIRRALAERLGEIHRYPTEIGRQARSALADHHGVAEANLVLTRGIDDAVDQLIAKYRSKRFCVVTPGFDGFRERLHANRCTFVDLQLDTDFRLPESELDKVDPDTFVLLASPNNPTGRRFSDSELESIFTRAYGCLVDQTYEDFAASELFPPPLERPHIYRYRSFSKGFGLAGFRLGALFGAQADMRSIARNQQFSHIDTLSCHAILCSVSGDELQQNVEAIIRLRTELLIELRRRGFDVRKSDGNFLLLRTERAKELVAFLEAQNILVKDTAPMGLPGYVRISVGAREAHAALITALLAFEQQDAPMEWSAIDRAAS